MYGKTVKETQKVVICYNTECSQCDKVTMRCMGTKCKDHKGKPECVKS